MAIGSGFYGVEVFVKVDGNKLPEHRGPLVQTDDEICSIYYIESKSDQAFEIEWVVRKDFEYWGDGISLQFYADGEQIGDGVVLQEYQDDSDMWGKVEGQRVDQDRMVKLGFADIQKGESSEGREQQSLSAVGTLRVEMTHINISRHYEGISTFDRKPNLGSVSDRALGSDKRSHSVVTMQAIPVEAKPQIFLTGDVVEHAPRPWMKVIEFRYRSHAALESLGLVPHPRPPNPPSSDRS